MLAITSAYTRVNKLATNTYNDNINTGNLSHL